MHQEELAAVLRRNIDTLMEVRRRTERRLPLSHRLAEGVARFAGSPAFVLWCCGVLAAWLVWNSGLLPGVRPFDPFPFAIMTLVASVGAIVLSSFVLVSQNRMSELVERRNELELQITLLTEHEVTRLVELSDEIAKHLGVKHGKDETLEELKRDVAPERVLEEIERARSAGDRRG